MRKFLLFCLCTTLSIFTFGQADTWSVKFSDAIISRYQPTINAMTGKGWEYSNGIILHGMEKVYLHTQDADYLNYIKAYVDTYVDVNGNVTGLGMTVDKIQPGVLCLFLYEQTGQTKYRTAATQIKNYVNNFYKTPDGGIWHKSEQTVTSYTYYNVMMVDGMYMLHPFLTKYASMFNEPALYDVATFQLLFLGSKVMPAPMTLPKHAWEYYDYKTWSDATTHMSTDVWSRGTGWYMMALADVLEYLPTTHANYSAILELFRRMATGVAANQHPTIGLWYQVVDKRTDASNWTESSGSGMFVYALKKGIDNGWLDAATYTPVVNLGWTGMQTQIATLGDGGPQIKQFCVASGVVNNTAAYYALGKTNCPTAYPWSGTQHPHGYCGILMAASEMEFPIATIPVTGVSLSPSSATISPAGTQQLTATVAPSNASNKVVTWSSSNTAVATVNTTGLVTGVSAGTAVITVTTQDGGFTAVSQISVQTIPVTGITVSPASATIETGATTTLAATVSPSNATNKTVTWSSSNAGIATVSSSGVVTGITAGTTVITATTSDGGYTATSNVTVNAVIPCTTIQYQAENGTYTSGTTIDSNYTGYSGTGFVNTPNAIGSYLQITVTAFIAGTHSFSVRFANGTTTNRTASVAVNGTTVISSLSMAATGAWSTWATSAFSVSLNAGTNTIRFTALTTGGLANIDRIDMCQKYIPVTGITVSPSSVSLAPGGTQQLTATVLPENASYPTVTWSSGNSPVATVNASGLVTAVASGTAIITATTTNGLTSTTQITVASIPVTGVTVSPSSANMKAGETTTLSAIVEPANASNKNVSWSTSNNSVATVSSSGMVTALAEGTANITVTTADGNFTAICPVSVYIIHVTGISVSPANATITIGGTAALTAAVSPVDATNQNYAWSTSNGSVATVSTSGVVTGLSAGTAIITTTSSDGGFTAYCEVTVNNVPVTSVSVSPASLTLNVGSTSLLSATVLPTNATNKSVTWTSGNTGMASVSPSGVVTGVASGTTAITVTTTDGGFSATCNVTVSTSCTATGYITFEKWLSITGTTVASLTSNANYPNSPSSSTTLTSFEIPLNSANNYGSRVSGYLCPPATGNYTFWIAGDDAAQLWLSTNNLAANKVLIAYTNRYTSSRQWNKYSTQKSAVKYLVQGNTYYIEALHKEGTGNDNMAVGWLKPGQTGTSPSQVIPGSVLSPRTPLKIANIESRSDLTPDLDVYPNPARNEILFNLPETLLGEKVMVSILNMSGQIILNKELIYNGPEQTDVSRCVPGLYILRVQNKDFNVTKSFTVYR